MRMLVLVSVLACVGCASAPQEAAPSSSKSARAPGVSRTADIRPTSTYRARPVNAASQEQVTPELRAAWEAKFKDHPLGNFTITLKDGKEYFCRREAPTGSNLKRRGLCLTAEEMEAAAAESQRQVREMQRPNTQYPVSPTPLAP